MSSEIAIRVKNLSKYYQIYEQPRDRLKQFVLPRLRYLLGLSPKKYFHEFWALRDVSFEVKKGETVGIIGRNGSGKSTLLQMICSTLNPSAGSIKAYGRIAALLELGSGFNPEFTGHENVYLNGSILGLQKDEIDARFEEIAAFADIGPFMEQAVKTYSSGMVVRLAFAVAVHVQPDILVVDEALSVGDIAFRNKCMQHIQTLMSRGVTILFVTHDISTLQLICSRVLWLDSGKLEAEGDPVKISQEYFVRSTGYDSSPSFSKKSLPTQQETGSAFFTDLRLCGLEGIVFTTGQMLSFSFSLMAKVDIDKKIAFAISIYRADGDWVIGQTSREENVFWPPPRRGDTCKGLLHFDTLLLAPGDYLVALAAYSSDFSICYALTDLTLGFSVRAEFPTWGKFIHPCRWLVTEA